MIHHTLYKITNKVNGKIYIGVHSTDNINDNYMGSGSQLAKAKKKYGIENFSKEIIALYDSREELLNAEKEYVDASFVERTDTYNCVVGGGHWSETPSEFMNTEHRRKIGDANKISLKGNSNRANSTTSPEAKENMKRCGAPGVKRVWTEEHKHNNRMAQIGKTASAETKAKLSESAKKRAKVECPHCGIFVPPQQFNRWHNDNCKHKGKP